MVENASSRPGRAGPLAHLRVLDLSRIMAAPWATQILADLGADVIKVERPGVGDDTRGWGPPFLKDKDGKPTARGRLFPLGQSRQALGHARSRRSPKGRRSCAPRRVVRYRAREFQGRHARPLRPRLRRPCASSIRASIYCSITGFGQDGPRRDQAAYDFMIQAMGGLMSVTGERDDQPGGGPQKVGVPIVDIMTGMYAAVAVLAALARRAETGEGDTSISPCSTCNPRFSPTRR